MPGVHDIVQQLQRNPRGIRCRDLCRVYDHYFGAPRKSATSHRVYKTPWPLETRSYSGRFVVRVPEEVHRRLAIQAAESGVSHNRLASAKLSR